MFSLLFCENFAEKWHQIISSFLCKEQRAETTQIKSIRKILSKGNNHLNHRILAAGEIWRDIKKDLRIKILVSKLDTALQSNKPAKFTTNVTCKVSPTEASITVVWRVSSPCWHLWRGHHHRVYSVYPGKLSTNSQQSCGDRRWKWDEQERCGWRVSNLWNVY